jgi:hypothetical protein
MKPTPTKPKPEAPQPYVPTGLVRPYTGDEQRRWKTPEEFTAWLRVDLGSEMDFCLERASRWRALRTETAETLRDFKDRAYPKDAKFQATLARLERAASEAAAEHEFALGQVAAEEAA